MTKPKTKLEAFRTKWKLDRKTGCWIWQASVLGCGYGNIRQKGKTLSAHRVAYELYKGKIRNGLHVLHKCDNPLCVNPDHLFLGTNVDNIKDRMSKDRPKPGTRGEASPRARLTEADVINMRAIYKYCPCTYNDLAKIYKVSHSAVNQILNRKKWKHVK